MTIAKNAQWQNEGTKKAGDAQRDGRRASQTFGKPHGWVDWLLGNNEVTLKDLGQARQASRCAEIQDRGHL